MTIQTHLIALTSKAMGSGKSTVAEHLENTHDWVRVSFATPIKKMTEALLDCIPATAVYERVYGVLKEEIVPTLGVSSRRIQQLLGTEFGRAYLGQDIWTDIAMAKTASLREEGYNVVIDDLRFPNELAAILNAGGTPVRVKRPSARVTSAHPSEGGLDHVRMSEIDNSGTVAQLHASVDVLLKSLYE